MVLTGANGAGKTNLLEALSLLSPGRGLRGARLAEISRLRENGAENGLLPPSSPRHMARYRLALDGPKPMATAARCISTVRQHAAKQRSRNIYQWSG